MDHRELVSLAAQAATKYSTTMALAFRRALGIVADVPEPARRRHRGGKRVKGIGYCIRNESSPMDRDM